MSREHQKDKAQSKIWLTMNIKGNNKQFYSYAEKKNQKVKGMFWVIDRKKQQLAENTVKSEETTHFLFCEESSKENL